MNDSMLVGVWKYAHAPHSGEKRLWQADRLPSGVVLLLNLILKISENICVTN